MFDRRIPLLASVFVVTACIGFSSSPEPYSDFENEGRLASTEGFCFAHDASGPDGKPAVCQGRRFGQCLNFQIEARRRLLAKWDDIPEKTKRSCVSKAQDEFRSDLNNRSIYRRASEGGWTRGYAAGAVEQCLADKLSQTPPESWEAQPTPLGC